MAIFDQMRDVAHALLQAKVDLEAHTLHRQPVQALLP
jgi:hypothetical protein